MTRNVSASAISASLMADFAEGIRVSISASRFSALFPGF